MTVAYPQQGAPSARAAVLAERVEQGAQEFVAAVRALSEEDWRIPCPGEQRSVGVLVHHVGTAYLAERDFVTALAAGQDMSGVTWDTFDQGNAQHAQQHATCTKEEALDLVQRNSVVAAEAIRGLSGEDLDRTARLRIDAQAPLTLQHFIEQHPISHPYLHLESIHAALSEAGR